MESPATEIQAALRELTSSDTRVAAHAVDKYFTDDAQLVAPLFTTPKAVGKNAVKAAYRIRQAMVYDSSFTFRCIGFGRVTVEKGVERVSGVVDCTQHVKLRLVPLPNGLNPVSTEAVFLRLLPALCRLFLRFDLVKCPDELYRICFQEVNIPSDWSSTGLHVFPYDGQIWMSGMATLVVGGTLAKVLG
ncbi:hypothetical protein BMF94_6148 [Rhodotorula taiwanensis]|uniref:SigF-like NTF2-like domain-containing protein n=1 Tax=Rhodotorula taiwanensis TaxID=741276 RepID=A0A2S5B1T3_9BASI|nr:hypothetical protein BMF94_6148 [Rhodotorula taiwanensis]